MSDELVEIGNRTTPAASGAQGTAAALDKTTAATAKRTSETERYQAALEKMAETQSEASGNTVGKQRAAEDAEWMAGMAERRRAVQGLASDEKTGGQEAAAAAEEVGQKVSWLTAQKSDLRAAVRGLKEEFPMLAHVARLAVNPIALAVAGIASSWAIWNQRVNESTRILAGAELPSVSPPEIAHVNSAAEAWASYNVELKKVRETYSGIAAEAERAQQATAAAFENQKKLMEATQAADQARLQAQRATGQISGTEFQARSLEGKVNAALSGSASEVKAQQAKIDAKEAEAVELENDAWRKREQAQHIRIASADDDKKTQADLEAQAKEAQNEVDARKANIGRLVDHMGGTESWKDSVWTKMQILWTGMSPEEQLAEERAGLERAQIPIQRLNEWNAQRGIRDQVRGERTNLYQTSSAEQGQAEDMFFNQVPADQAMLDQKAKTMQLTTLLGVLKEAYDAQGEGAKQAKDMADQINRRVKEGIASNSELLQALEAQRQFNSQVSAWCTQLEQQIGAMRNRP